MTTKQVWKFDVRPGDFTVDMPRGAHVLTVQMQHERPMMWALVDPTEPVQKRRFVLVGTGHPVVNAEWMRYVGTFQVREGQLVFHLFERVKGG
jgi:hypothetical protein